MAGTPEDILPAIVNARDAGLTRARITKLLAKKHHGEISKTLKALIDAEEIWGPLKHGGSETYFAAGRGPSPKTAAENVSRLVGKAGTRLVSAPTLKKKVTGKDALFLADGVKLAVATKAIIQLACGRSIYYLHRDVAAPYFSAAIDSPEPLPPGRGLTMETVRPAMLRLIAEQGGLKIVKIYDLLKSLGVSKDELHQFLVQEAKAGRMTIHPTTSVDLRAEIIEAGIRLPGFSEPFVTVAIED
jgi:hypothetical protein